MMRRLLALLALWISLAAYAQVVSEHDMKAAYLYNFAHLFDWPESSRANFHLCVLGDEEVGAALQRFDERRVDGKRIVIARLSSLAPIRLCDILYVGAGEQASLPKVRSTLGNQPTLVVADRGNLPAVGVMLGIENDRLVFDVNLEHCERAGLKAKQTLLGFARSVRRASDGEVRPVSASR
jgi:hypothetical protein